MQKRDQRVQCQAPQQQRTLSTARCRGRCRREFQPKIVQRERARQPLRAKLGGPGHAGLGRDRLCKLLPRPRSTAPGPPMAGNEHQLSLRQRVEHAHIGRSGRTASFMATGVASVCRVATTPSPPLLPRPRSAHRHGYLAPPPRTTPRKQLVRADRQWQHHRVADRERERPSRRWQRLQVGLVARARRRRTPSGHWRQHCARIRGGGPCVQRGGGAGQVSRTRGEGGRQTDRKCVRELGAHNRRGRTTAMSPLASAGVSRASSGV